MIQEKMATCQVCKTQLAESQLMKHNFREHRLLFIGLPLLIAVIITGFLVFKFLISG